MKKSFPTLVQFQKILDELAELYSFKNADYTLKDKPFGNFERVAQWVKEYKLLTSPCSTEVKVAMIYMLKQWDCFMLTLGSGKQLKAESLKHRQHDILVYLILIELLLNKQNKSKKNNK